MLPVPGSPRQLLLSPPCSTAGGAASGQNSTRREPVVWHTIPLTSIKQGSITPSPPPGARWRSGSALMSIFKGTWRFFLPDAASSVPQSKMWSCKAGSGTAGCRLDQRSVKSVDPFGCRSHRVQRSAFPGRRNAEVLPVQPARMPPPPGRASEIDPAMSQQKRADVVALAPVIESAPTGSLW